MFVQNICIKKAERKKISFHICLYVYEHLMKGRKKHRNSYAWGRDTGT